MDIPLPFTVCAIIIVGLPLIVFASGKDRAIAGSELHANFKLSSDGEYFALVEPSSATAVAVALSDEIRALGLRRVGVILSGGNVDLNALAALLADRTVQGRTPTTWAHAAIAAYNQAVGESL